MTSAVGGQLFIKPIMDDGDIKYGEVEDVGYVAIKFSTFKICDIVTYNKDKVYKSVMFNGDIVDVVLYNFVDYDRSE